MKKTLIVLGLTTVFAFANELQSQIPADCVETKLSEATSIVSCPSAEYKANFVIYADGTRNTKQPVHLEKIGEVKPIIVQQLSK